RSEGRGPSALERRANGRPEEPADFNGRRQSSVDGTSRMNREVHVRICERLGVKLPRPTRQIRMLRSMWRGLETWLGREASRPKPARQSSTLPTWRELEKWRGRNVLAKPARQLSTLPTWRGLETWHGISQTG